MSPKIRRSSSFALVGLALLPLACGGSRASVYPVKGEVFVQGQPAVGAAVTFHPLNAEKSDLFPTGTVEADGSFRLTTLSAYDGAPPGDYVVTITWSDSHREDGEIQEGPDKLQRRYAYPTGSGLKATVQPGKNLLARFDLN